ALLPGVNRDALFPVADLEDDFFDRPHFARPLYLHMAALASCNGRPTARKMDLLHAALDREESYLQGVLDDVPDLNRTLTGAQLRPVLTLATLAMAARPPGDATPTAEALLSNTTLGRVLDDLERPALARLLTRLYPLPDPTSAPGAMDALRPDALGEGLVYDTLKDDPTLATYALAAERDTATLASAATVLVRAALALEDDDPEAWLRNHLPPLQKRPRLVKVFNDAIHKDTSRLRLLAASIAAWMVPHARQALQENPDDEQAQRTLAHALSWQGLRLSSQGQRKASLAATEEAVTIRRRLAQRNPDAFEPDLATSLNNLGAFYSNLGRREDALTATEEAVAIRRRLAQRNPDAFEPNLAMSLGARGNALRVAEHPADAATAFAEGLYIITPRALRLPAAFLQLGMNLAQSYIQACQAAEQEPNAALVAPLVTLMEQMQATQGPSQDAPPTDAPD
ncbi:MAG: tetratricopeptide repeat protein, partial [Bacteroidota bacterium]